MGASDPFDPVGFVRRWGAAMQLAPNALVQPILPGWNLTLNAFNSSAPQTEVEVLKQHSYGRQLGKINAVLCALLHRADPDRADPAFAEFRAMADEIERIKAGAFEQRIDKLLGDLDQLRRRDRAAHETLVQRLRERLDL